MVHGADMLNVIHEACRTSRSDQAHHLAEGRRDRSDRSGVTARTESGQTYTGAALIGCDGLWSTVRSIVVGDGKPVVSGHIAYRAVLPTADGRRDTASTR